MIPEPRSGRPGVSQASPVEVGPLLGHVTATSARVFIRLREGHDSAGGILADSTRLQPWSAPGGAPDGRSFAGDVPLRHGSGIVHEIRLSLRGELLGTVWPRAAEPPATSGRIAFAFGSCWKPTSLRDSDRIWRDLLALTRGRIVDHLLLLGDQVYADESPLPGSPRETATSRALALGPDSALADRVAPFRQACADAWNSPGLRLVQSMLPTNLVWDDHEIVNSYGARAEHFTPSGRALFDAAAAAFDEMQGSRNPPPLAPGSRAWAFRRGPAAFLGLDLRTHRNFLACQLLGEEQRRAVRAFVEGEARGARVLFVATSVPMLHLPRIHHALRGIGDIRDQWEVACKADRAWLVSLLRDFEEGGRRRAVLLGGDAHSASAAHLSDASGHALWQVVSSPLAQRLPAPLYPLMQMLGRRFGVTTAEGERLAALIVRRWSGPNLGVVRGSVDEERVDLSFELYRPGRRTQRVDLVSRLAR